MLAGRRGEISWKKPNFLGQGQSLDYDAYEAIIFGGPLVLFRPIHTFEWGEDGRFAKAIPLRADRGFRLQAYMQEWSGLLAIATFMSTPVLGLLAIVWKMQERGTWILLLLGALLSAAAFVAGLIGFIRSGKVGQRDRDIRLLLGMHAWGSSDPAYWHTDLLAQVMRPNATPGGAPYAQWASCWLASGEWCRAMWAARLCAAVEDEATGERLTDQILNSPVVQQRLPHVRKQPHTREMAFGPTPPLATWVHGDIHGRVFTISAGRSFTVINLGDS